MQPINETIANRYRLQHRLGAGSYAETFLADDTALDRRVAVKILRPEFTKTQEELARFRREAQTAASLQHRNVVPVYDAGAWNGTHYLVMEWVNGTTLKRAIRSRRRLGFESAINIVDDLLAGLAAIHDAGIIHRDIKPHNILLAEDGTAKLTDFGVALTKYSLGDGTHAETYGTAAYMAPEQALGGNTGPQSDLYAVGVILFEMLTGRLPFIADDPFEVIHQHVHYPIPRPKRINPNIPSGLEAVLLRSLAKQPHERYASAGEMRDALRAAYEEARAKAASPAGPRPINHVGRARLPWIRLASATALVALMLAAIAGSASLATRDLNEDASSDTANGQVAELPDMFLNSLDPRNALSMRREGETQPPEDVPNDDLIPTVTPDEESEPQNIPAPSHTGPPGGVADASNQSENSDAADDNSSEATEPEVAAEQDSQAQQPTTEPQEPVEQTTEEAQATQESQNEQHTGQGGTPAGEPDANVVDEANNNEGYDDPAPPAPEQDDGDQNSQQTPDVANNEQGPPEHAGNDQAPPENPGNGEGSPQNQGQGDYSGNTEGLDEQEDAENEPETAQVSESQEQGNGQANADDHGSDDDGKTKQQGSNSTETTKVEKKKPDKERKKKSNGDSSDSAGNNDRDRSDEADDDRKKERKVGDKGNRNDRDDDDGEEDDRKSEDREESSSWVSSERSGRSWNDNIEAVLALAADLDSNRDDADKRDRDEDRSADEERNDESQSSRDEDGSTDEDESNTSRDNDRSNGEERSNESHDSRGGDREESDEDRNDLKDVAELFDSNDDDEQYENDGSRRDSDTERKALEALENIFGNS